MVQKVSRGRPRKFDSDQVLARVRDVFWKTGFAATSMDQLSTATGVHKPSLYGAFGDKKQLYLKALDAYIDQVRQGFGATLSIPRVMDSLSATVDLTIRIFARDSSGCFMMSTAMAETGDDPEIAEMVRGAMDMLDQALVQRFRKAQEEGEIAPEADPVELAAMYVANHYNLAARARAGFPVEHLRASADRMLAAIRRAARIDDMTGPEGAAQRLQ